jgi:hypothetical protein
LQTAIGQGRISLKKGADLRQGILTVLTLSGLTLCPLSHADAADTELIGKWTFNLPSVFQVNENISFTETVIKDKNTMGGVVFQDLEGNYSLDMSAKPRRLVVTVIKSDPNQVVKMKPGDKINCIYEVLKTRTLRLNCHSQFNQPEFPTEFHESFAFNKETP